MSNVFVVCAENRDFNDEALHSDINQELELLEKDFHLYARGEVPRLSLKRSKVLRRLGGTSKSKTVEERDVFFNQALSCVDKAMRIATEGGLVLHEADLQLEKTKVLLTSYVHTARLPKNQTEVKESLKQSLQVATHAIRSLGYKKRFAELEAIQREVESLDVVTKQKN